MRNLAILLVLVLGGCMGGSSGFARGAYGLENAPLRDAMGQRIARIVDVAKNDVAELRKLYKDANAKDPGVGTGALVQAILIRVALELATGGQLEVKPAPEPGGPSP